MVTKRGFIIPLCVAAAFLTLLVYFAYEWAKTAELYQIVGCAAVVPILGYLLHRASEPKVVEKDV